jgi:hypothetical protein
MTIHEDHRNSDGTASVKKGGPLDSQGSAETSSKLRLRAGAGTDHRARSIHHAHGVGEWDEWKSVRDLA